MFLWRRSNKKGRKCQIKTNFKTLPCPQDVKRRPRHCSSHVPIGGHMTSCLNSHFSCILMWSKVLKKNVFGALNPSSKTNSQKASFDECVEHYSWFWPSYMLHRFGLLYVCVYKNKRKKKKKKEEIANIYQVKHMHKLSPLNTRTSQKALIVILRMIYVLVVWP